MEKAIAVILIVLAVLVIVGAVMSEAPEERDTESGIVQLEVQDSAEEDEPEASGKVSFEVVGGEANE